MLDILGGRFQEVQLHFYLHPLRVQEKQRRIRKYKHADAFFLNILILATLIPDVTIGNYANNNVNNLTLKQATATGRIFSNILFFYLTNDIHRVHQI